MATVAYMADDRTMSMGRVFERAFATIAHNPVATIGLALVFGGIPSVVLNLAATFSGMAATRLDAPAKFIGFAVLTWLAAVAIGSIAQGALVRATVAESEGRKIGFGESATAALHVLLPLVGIALIVTLGMTVGLVLLIVPGLMIYVIWSVALPVCIEQGEGVFKSLSRSRELTRGARWKIFGVLLVFLVAYLLLTMGVRAVGVRMYSVLSPASDFSAASVIATAVLTTLSALVNATMQASIYVELREWKEGGTASHLEQVFS